MYPISYNAQILVHFIIIIVFFNGKPYHEIRTLPFVCFHTLFVLLVMFTLIPK